MRRIVFSVLVLLAVSAPVAGAVRVARSSSTLPTVSTTFGHTPKIVIPKSAPPKKLSATVLHKGTGPVVKKGDLIVANYVGQIWGGKVFGTSFNQPVPQAFQIGAKGLIPGWNDTIVGLHVGSRVLLVIPPVDGYGKTGNSGAGITGTDTLVFVVDILGTYSSDLSGDVHATVERSGLGGVNVTGALGSQPKVTIAKGTKKPTAVLSTVLARGHGAPVKAGFVIVQAVWYNWTGKVAYSTWTAKVPDASQIGITSEPSGLDPLIGTPLGSRCLIESPASGGEGPFVTVLDLLAEPNGSISQSK